MLRARSRRRRGVALVWMAVIGLVLMGLLGLAIDTGYVYLVSRQLQDAADAAALAGAIKVGTDTVANVQAAAVAPPNKAAGAVVQYSYTSGTNDSTKDIVIGTYNSGTFTATTTSPNAVKVIARRTTGALNGPVNLFFGPIFGINTAESKRTAIAHQSESSTGAGLVTLDPTGTAVSVGGNAILNVSNGGAVYVNSNGSGATAIVTQNSKTKITASDVYVAANETGSSFNTTGTVHPNSPVSPDPLGWLQSNLPSSATVQQTATLNVTSAMTINPGVYKGGITVSGGGNLTLNSGVYILGSSSINNVGLQVTSNISSASGGVLIYVPYGPITFSGGSVTNLSAMTTGTYANIVMFQGPNSSRNPDSGYTGPSNPTTTATLAGNGTFSVVGAMYFPSSTVTVSGGGNLTSTGNEIIAYDLATSGNGTFTLTYNGTTAFKVTSPGKSPYLVQ